MKSAAATPQEYLDALPDDRRELVARLRDTVNARIPEGFAEGMLYGMISWYVPLERYPDTYNGRPLAVASLASQKRHVSLYLMGIYAEPDEGPAWIEAAFEAADTKLDMGKSCVRFKRIDDVPFEVVGDAVARLSVEDFIERYEASRRR